MTEPDPQRPFVGVHLMLIRDNAILLMKRTVKNSFDGMYAFIAGRIDTYESPTAALVREAMEEAGIHILAEDLDLVATTHHAKTDYKGGEHDVIDFYFVPKKWSGTPVIMEPDRASELAFFPLDNLPEPIPAGFRAALKALDGGPNFIEY